MQHWERYYQTGAIATGPAGAHGYEGAVRALWEGYFARLPEEATIVDLGTGNGALVEIALDVARLLGRRWEVHGVDAARIDPFRDVPGAAERLAGAIFHPGIRAQALPFAAGSVTAACGHYALEYMPLAETLAELARVLAPAAPAQFVLHHVDSRLVATARADLEAYACVLDEVAILDRLRDLVKLPAHAADAAQRAGEQLRVGIHTLRERLPEDAAARRKHPCDVALDGVRQLLALRNRAGASEALAEIDRFEAELRAGRERHRDLVAHALDAAGLDALAGQAAAAGLGVRETRTVVQDPDLLLGWCLVLEAPRARV